MSQQLVHPASAFPTVPPAVPRSAGALSFGTDASLAVTPGWDNVTGLGAGDWAQMLAKAMDTKPDGGTRLPG